MNKKINEFVAVFIRQGRQENPEESLEDTLLTESRDNQSMLSWEDTSMKAYFKHILPYASPIFLVVKWIGYLVMFILTTYVLLQCSQYYKEAKVQQEHIYKELNSFHASAEEKLKDLNDLQETMEDKLENINILTEQGSKRIKEMFTFSKTDLLKDYEEDNGSQCDFIPLNLRFDCHPENGASELSCRDRGCCWNVLHQLNYENLVPLDVPYCYYPKNWSLYKYQNFSKDGNDFTGLLSLERNSFYKKDLKLVKIEATGIDDTTLRVKVKFTLVVTQNDLLYSFF